MPLIGTIDSTRAQQILKTLLGGVSGLRARVAIINITGVLLVDTQVANVLLQAAQAVKLLGAQTVLTGIRPEVAQTVVGLGASLQDIVTRSMLQSGIAYALRREGVEQDIKTKDEGRGAKSIAAFVPRPSSKCATSSRQAASPDTPPG